jgi:hypothetical protein
MEKAEKGREATQNVANARSKADSHPLAEPECRSNGAAATTSSRSPRGLRRSPPPCRTSRSNTLSMNRKEKYVTWARSKNGLHSAAEWNVFHPGSRVGSYHQQISLLPRQFLLD